MKNNSMKVCWSLLGLWAFLLITPAFVAAEDNDSDMSLSTDISILSESSENAEILDVEVSDLLGIDNLDVKIPNSEENTEELASVSINDEEMGHIEADVLTNTATTESNEQAAVNLAVEELLGTDEIVVEVLKHKENEWNGSHSNESSVADVAAEELLGTDEVDLEVLKHKENEWYDSYSNESSVADIGVEELLGTDEVNLEILAHEEDALTNGSSNNEAVFQATIDDLITTDQIELNVLKREETMQNQIHMEEQQAVHLEIKDLPLLETLHVGVLESKSTEDSSLLQDASALLTVGLGDDSSSTASSLLKEVELNVLQNSQSSSDNFETEKSAVVGLEVADTSLGDLSTYILLSESTDDMDDNTSSNSGLVEVISDDLILLEDIHLGVLDRHMRDDGEVSTFSEGVLEFNIVSDLTDKLDVEILTNDEITANRGTHRNGKIISIGLINDLVGETNVDILPTESYVTAALVNPMPPTEDVEVVAEGDTVESPNEDSYTDNTPVTNEDGDIVEEQNPPTDEEIIVVDGGDSGPKDTMIETPTLTEGDESLIEEEDESGIAANFNNMDGNSFAGSSLPQTGGFFSGVMLLMIALSLLGSGWTIRKLA